MTREEELQKIVNDAQAELSEIRLRERDERNLSFTERFVGKHFRSSDSSDNEGWVYYLVVTKIDEGGWLCGFKFQIFSGGLSIIIDRDEDICDGERFEGWEPISEEEFVVAWQTVLSSLPPVPGK